MAQPAAGATGYQREMLLLAVAVIVAAFALEVLPDDRVALRGLPSVTLPPMCLTRHWTGIDCPGCGLTRSFVHLAHGDWWESWHIHHLGWLLAAAVVLQVPYRLYCLRTGERFFPAWVGMWFGYVTIALLVGNWLVTRVLH